MVQHDLLPGMLDLLILKTLENGPLHGWGIAQRIEQVSGVFRIKLGSLYPALQRLEQAGLVDAEWRQSDNNRRARYYALSRSGRRHLSAERSEWKHLAAGVARILEST
jgi:transcriptional regulator